MNVRNEDGCGERVGQEWGKQQNFFNDLKGMYSYIRGNEARLYSRLVAVNSECGQIVNFD